ncbi:MAG: endonuclease/exonuclease/phosphatase family protein, partial [Fidelibacterota bacterium]
MTWNLENFGQRVPAPIHRVAEIVRDLDVDVVALQEIVSQEAFESLVNSLDGWGGFRASPSSTWQELAYLYRESRISVVETPFEIYPEDSRAFPREPFVFRFTFGSTEMVAINNHLKCCGNGIIDADPDDEESRRQMASILLEDYV